MLVCIDDVSVFESKKPLGNHEFELKKTNRKNAKNCAFKHKCKKYMKKK